MPEARIGGTTLYYETYGAGEPLLLLNGTAQDITGWLLQIPWLAERRTVIAFDPRDCGRSGYVTGGYTPADLAADAAALCAELGLGSVDLLGYSLGGAVAQELALAQPRLVRSMVLLSTWARTDPWFAWKMGSWITLAGSLDRETLYDVLLLDLFTHRWFADSGFVEGFRDLIRQAPYPQQPDGFVRQCRADRAHDALDRLEAVRARTLVVTGEEDVLTPVRCGRELEAAITGASLMTIPEAGHGALFERPDELRRIIEGFLDG